MPSTLAKTRKQIAKKRNGNIGALHQGSRDSKRLHKAQVRDERLEKIAASRKKNEQPIIERVAFFQDAVRENGYQPLSPEAVQQSIKTYVHQYDEEFDAVKKTRRPGRPASAREDLLKLKITTLEKEYKNGFLLPELTSEANIALLERWEGSWTYLTTLTWVKMSESGTVSPSSFPPKGDH